MARLRFPIIRQERSRSHGGLVTDTCLHKGIRMNALNEQIVLEENFDGPLDGGWSWLREHPDYWRLRDGGLEICVEPGHAETVKNALIRPAPDRSDGTYAIEVTVTNYSRPTQQWEQAGITWLHDGVPVWQFAEDDPLGGFRQRGNSQRLLRANGRLRPGEVIGNSMCPCPVVQAYARACAGTRLRPSHPAAWRAQRPQRPTGVALELPR